MSAISKTCPYCGGPVTCDMVDIGIGYQQSGPYVCEYCHAIQMSPYEDLSKATPEETVLLWWAGDIVVPDLQAYRKGTEPPWFF